MSVSEKLIKTHYEGKVAWVTLDNPSKLNALSLDLLREIEDVFREIEAKPEIHVVVVTGEGKAFVAGADIKAMSVLSEAAAKEWARYGSKVFRLIELSPKIVIALINGYALGGGLELAMACDIRIAAKSAKLGLPEVSLGIIPGFSGTQRLPALVGAGKAKELIYTGEIIPAEEAIRIGLVNGIAEDGQLKAQGNILIDKILKHSPNAQRLAKTAVNTTMTAPLFQGTELEENLFARCFSHPDAKAGMDAFLNKQKPEFQ